MMEGGGRIVIVGTFDTKGEEHAHLRRCIQQVPVTPNLAFVLLLQTSRLVDERLNVPAKSFCMFVVWHHMPVPTRWLRSMS